MPSHTETVLANPRKIGTLENQIQTAQLEQLKRIADALEARSGWISTLDRFPAKHQKVIVPGGMAQYRGGLWYSGMEEPMFQRPIQWEVTRWMQLPE